MRAALLVPARSCPCNECAHAVTSDDGKKTRTDVTCSGCGVVFQTTQRRRGVRHGRVCGAITYVPKDAPPSQGRPPAPPAPEPAPVRPPAPQGRTRKPRPAPAPEPTPEPPDDEEEDDWQPTTTLGQVVASLGAVGALLAGQRVGRSTSTSALPPRAGVAPVDPALVGKQASTNPARRSPQGRRAGLKPPARCQYGPTVCNPGTFCQCAGGDLKPGRARPARRIQRGPSGVIMGPEASYPPRNHYGPDWNQ